jgi:glutaredoxin 3
MASRVEIFTKSWCPYCVRAKALLARKGVAFEEISLDDHPERTEEMVRRAGRTTVPQVFADGRPLGGSDDIHALEAAGRLDEALGIGARGNSDT